MLSAATRYWERIGTVPWYCLTPEEMTTDCLVWVYDRLHGTVGTVLDEIRWVNGMLCTNMSSGQPQRAYSSLTSFLACVLGISTPMERPMGGRFFEQLEQLCDLIDRDLIPPLVRLITDDRFDRSVVVAVAEWTNNFFPREQHKDRGVLASPVLRTSGVQPSKYVKFRTCEHEGCPLSSSGRERCSYLARRKLGSTVAAGVRKPPTARVCVRRRIGPGIRVDVTSTACCVGRAPYYRLLTTRH